MTRAIAAELTVAAFRVVRATRLTTLPRSTASHGNRLRTSSRSTATTARNSMRRLSASKAAASSPRGRRSTELDPASLSGARPYAYPGFVEFCDPTLSGHAPTGAGWAHEIKADGYRGQVHVVD